MDSIDGPNELFFLAGSLRSIQQERLDVLIDSQNFLKWVR